MKCGKFSRHEDEGNDYSEPEQDATSNDLSSCMTSSVSASQNESMPCLDGKAVLLQLFQSSLPRVWFDDEPGFTDDRPTLALQRDVRLR